MKKSLTITLLTAILFSGSFVAAKYTTYDLKPLTTSFLRYAIALLFLTVLAVIKNQNPFKVDKKDLFKLILLGVSGIVGYHYFFFTSIKFTSVTNTGIINATSPILTAILAMIFLREKLSTKNYIGLVISFVGVLILLSKGDFYNLIGLNFQYGDLLMYCAVFSWVIYSLIIKTLAQKYSSLVLTFYATFTGVILLFFLALTEDMFYQISNISFNSVLSIFYMGVLASGLGYLLYNLGIKNIGPTKTASIVYSSVPILVAILSYLFFKESFTITLIISIVLIIGGLNLILIKKEGRK